MSVRATRSLPPLAGTAGRLDRAMRNFLETFPLFAAAVLIAALAGRHNWMTEWGAVLYFAARVAYVPLYAYGVRIVRSAPGASRRWDHFDLVGLI